MGGLFVFFMMYYGDIMQCYMFKLKIYCVVVMYCELYYEGLCVIDEDLFEVVGFIENEWIDIWNINNGECFLMYVIKGECGSGMILLNGLVVCCVQFGDFVIIVVFVMVDEVELQVGWKLKFVFIDEGNKIKGYCDYVLMQNWM